MYIYKPNPRKLASHELFDSAVFYLLNTIHVWETFKQKYNRSYIKKCNASNTVQPLQPYCTYVNLVFCSCISCNII